MNKVYTRLLGSPVIGLSVMLLSVLISHSVAASPVSDHDSGFYSSSGVAHATSKPDVLKKIEIAEKTAEGKIQINNDYVHSLHLDSMGAWGELGVRSAVAAPGSVIIGGGALVGAGEASFQLSGGLAALYGTSLLASGYLFAYVATRPGVAREEGPNNLLLSIPDGRSRRYLQLALNADGSPAIRSIDLPIKYSPKAALTLLSQQPWRKTTRNELNEEVANYLLEVEKTHQAISDAIESKGSLRGGMGRWAPGFFRTVSDLRAISKQVDGARLQNQLYHQDLQNYQMLEQYVKSIH